jgi:hypothetical protein
LKKRAKALAQVPVHGMLHQRTNGIAIVCNIYWPSSGQTTLFSCQNAVPQQTSKGQMESVYEPFI